MAMVRMEQALGQRLEQRLKLAPRMILSMKVLQLPIVALQEHIEQALTENPTLEVSDPNADAEGEGPGAGADAGEGRDEGAEREESAGAEPMLESSPGDEPELTIDEGGQQAEDFGRLEDFGDQFDNLWESGDPRPGRGAGDGERDAKLDLLANTPQREGNLLEDLRQQFAVLTTPPRVRQAGEIILDRLDERGFLSTPLEALPGEAPAGAGLTFVDFVEALDAIQQFDPPGVGARDVRECLLIQLERLDPDRDPDGLRPLAARLVADCFDDLEHNRLPAIAKRTGESLGRIEQAIQYIARHCDPSPGLTVGSRANPTVVPDVILTYNEARDDYDIELTDTYLPNLTTSRYYHEQLERGNLDKQAKAFLLAKLRDAHWLIDAIEQRRTTLRRVVREVVRTQRAFLEHGPAELKPLPMVDVARRLGIHVGTVSRAVADKYVQSPRGIFRLRDCFTGGTQTQSGEQVSYDAIREKVREIVAGEDKHRPLSDDEIVKLLQQQGIPLARRTVAKYRSELDIPPARRRRVY